MFVIEQKTVNTHSNLRPAHARDAQNHRGKFGCPFWRPTCHTVFLLKWNEIWKNVWFNKIVNLIEMYFLVSEGGWYRRAEIRIPTLTPKGRGSTTFEVRGSRGCRIFVFLKGDRRHPWDVRNLHFYRASWTLAGRRHSVIGHGCNFTDSVFIWYRILTLTCTLLNVLLTQNNLFTVLKNVYF